MFLSHFSRHIANRWKREWIVGWFFFTDWERSRMLLQRLCVLCRCANDFSSSFFVFFVCIQRVNNLTTRHNLSFLYAMCTRSLALSRTQNTEWEGINYTVKVVFKWWWCNLLSRSLNMKCTLWYESKKFDIRHWMSCSTTSESGNWSCSSWWIVEISLGIFDRQFAEKDIFD